MTQADTKTFDSYIIKGVGGFYYVKTADGVVECKPRGIFRKRKITLHGAAGSQHPGH